MDNLKVTLIQSELHWEKKTANLEMFSKKLAAIPARSTDLIVLPEMFNTGFTMKTHEFGESGHALTLEWMAQQSTEKKAVVVGSLIVEENKRYYNRLIWMEPDGTFQKYDKRHLFRMGKEDEHFTPGNKRLIVELKGWKICPMVCYDLRFPVWSRNVDFENQESRTKTSSYDLLIYIANWPEKRNHAWKTLLQARAIENQAYVVGVNRVGTDGHSIDHSGDSAVMDAKGEIISHIPARQEYLEEVELNYDKLMAYRKEFPVGMDADAFHIGE
jgi:omega-amidase